MSHVDTLEVEFTPESKWPFSSYLSSYLHIWIVAEFVSKDVCLLLSVIELEHFTQVLKLAKSCFWEKQMSPESITQLLKVFQREDLPSMDKTCAHDRVGSKH